MPPRKTPTSSLSGSHAAYFLSLYLTVVTATAIGLLINRVYYRTLAKIWEIRSGGTSPETSAAQHSPANRLPLEVVEMFIAYLRYDTPSLRACTMTCYSWYIAAVSHLHHTLTVTPDCWGGRDPLWPHPLSYMISLGLVPLIKEFRVRERCDGLSLGYLNYFSIYAVSGLANVQKLDIQRLNIPNFMPVIQWCFGHFSPKLRSLVLRQPEGSRRQIIYFIGLFQNLQDLELYDSLGYLEPADDPTLIPAFVPPLRGSLKLMSFNMAGFLKDMIHLFGGIRFNRVNLYEVREMRLLLDTCTETLNLWCWIQPILLVSNFL
jgi:hypothetical protein